MRIRVSLARRLLLLVAFASPLPHVATGFANPPSRVMPRLVSDGAGGGVLVWLDQTPGTSLVRAQRFSADGAPMPGWPAEGALVSPGAGWFDNIVALADGAGGAWIAWDKGTPYGSVQLRRVNANGVTLVARTNDPGSLAGSLSTRPDSSITPGPRKFDSGDGLPAIAADGAGGVFFAYRHSSELFGSDVFVQRYAASGAVTPAWPGLSLEHLWSGGGDPVMCPDDSGGAYVAWSEGFAPSSVVHVTRVTASGTIAAGWSAIGTRVCAAGAAPGIVTDGAGGAIVAWADSRDASHDQVFAQRVHPDGTVAWTPEGVGLCPLASQFGPNQVGWYGAGTGRHAQIVADGAGGAVVVWVDLRGGTAAGASDIYAQRVTASGALASGWPATGAPVCTAPGDQALPNLAADGSGGAYFAWQDDRVDPTWSLRWQRLDGAGQIASDQPVDGAIASASSASNALPVLVSDGGSGAFVAWVDVSDSLPIIRQAHVVAGAGGQRRMGSSLSIASDLNPAREGRTITLTATVQPFTASGSVDFFDFGQRFATVPLQHGVATTTRRLTSVGSRTFVANYLGDASYAPGGGYVVEQTLPRIVTPLQLASSANPTLVNRHLVLAATLPAAATGTVDFLDAGARLATVPVVAGMASVPYVAPAVEGPRVLTASYSGDTAYAPANAVVSQVIYVRFPTLVSLAGPPSPCRQLQATLTATVSPATATGTFVFADGGTAFATAPIVDGSATVTYRAPSFSARNLSATYGGDAQFAANVGWLSQDFVGEPTLTRLSGTPNSAWIGQSVTLTATVQPASATGSVQFYDGDTPLDAAPLVGASATDLVPVTSATRGNFWVAYSGDTTYSRSIGDFSLMLVPLGSATTLSANAVAVRVGSLVKLTAIVQPPLDVGTVQFLVDGAPLASSPVAAGIATLVTDALPVGSLHVTAWYSGSPGRNGSLSNVVNESVLLPDGPALRVLAPNNGESATVGQPFEIHWDPGGPGAVGRVSLYVSRSVASPTWELIAGNVPNDGAYTWTVTGPGTNQGATTEMSALIGVFDDSGRESNDTSDLPFAIIDVATPVVVTRLDAEARDDGVRVSWVVGDPRLAGHLQLERADAEAGPWQPVLAAVRDDAGTRVVDDGGVRPGAVYWYRLHDLSESGAASLFGPVRVVTADAPRAWALGEAWPNPSRGPVALRFTVASASRVRLSLLDLAGREVRVLVDAAYSPGRYQADWDGRDARGGIPGGVYFARFSTPAGMFVRRIAIVR